MACLDHAAGAYATNRETCFIHLTNDLVCAGQQCALVAVGNYGSRAPSAAPEALRQSSQ